MEFKISRQDREVSIYQFVFLYAACNYDFKEIIAVLSANFNF